MEHQRIVKLGDLVALATLQPDGTVFVQHIPIFLPPQPVLGLVGTPKIPPPESAPIPNPSVPVDVPESPTIFDAALDLVPDLLGYRQDIDPEFVKIPCAFRERRRNPSATDAQLAAICEAQSSQSQLAGIIEDIVPSIVVIGGGLVGGTVIGGIIGETVAPATVSGAITTIGPQVGGAPGVGVVTTLTPAAEAERQAQVERQQRLLPGISNTVLAVASFGIAGVLLAIFLL